MLTPGHSRIDERTSDPRAGDQHVLPDWWRDYPAILERVLGVDEAYRTTIAPFGTDAAVALPWPIPSRRVLPDSQNLTFRGLFARELQRLDRTLTAAGDVWDAAQVEVQRIVNRLDGERRNELRNLNGEYGRWLERITTLPREAVSSDPGRFSDELDAKVLQLQAAQQRLRATVERNGLRIEDWIDTVSSVDLPGVDEQQRARRDLLAELRRTFPDNVMGSVVWRTIDDGIKAALDARDVVVVGEHRFDASARRYLASRMEMLARENVGAVLVQVPRELQPALNRFKSTQDEAQLLSDLESAGIGGGEALVEMAAAAANNEIEVVAFDTRWGHGSEPTQLKIKNHYMGAVANQTLQELPEGKKILALVNVVDTNSHGGVDALTGGASFDPRSPDVMPPAGSVAYHQGGYAFGDDATFVYSPQR